MEERKERTKKIQIFIDLQSRPVLLVGLAEFIFL